MVPKPTRKQSKLGKQTIQNPPSSFQLSAPKRKHYFVNEKDNRISAIINKDSIAGLAFFW